MRASILLVIPLTVAALGCEEPLAGPQRAQRPASSETASKPGPTRSLPGGVHIPGQAETPSQPGSQPGSAQPPAQPEPSLPSSAQPPAQPKPSPSKHPPAEPPQRVKAQPGVGAKGKNLQEGVITTPAKAYFQIREKTVFLQVQKALNLYRGLRGRLPQSHEEFMQDVIRANGIQLPELPAGSRYVWDPDQGELMVERPRS